MKQNTKQEKILSDIPEGALRIENHTPQYAPFFEKTLYARSDGRGLMEYWTVFPGVVLSRSRYQAGYYEFCHAPLGSVLQINHCRQGRLGWDMQDDASIYLGEEDISFHKMDACAESVVHLPAGYYEGMAVMIDMEALEQEPPAILREAGVSGKRLCEIFCGRRRYAVMAADLRLDGIFSGLYTLPSRLQLPYFKLKVQELLLFLSALEPAEAAEQAICPSWQIAIVQAVHKQLTERLDWRFTIEELSRQHGLNPSTLKAVFKRVYGAPMAAYMRRYRLRKAARLLGETEISIAEIAALVGYENPSKFSAAFQSVFQVLPKEYRKRTLLAAMKQRRAEDENTTKTLFP